VQRKIIDSKQQKIVNHNIGDLKGIRATYHKASKHEGISQLPIDKRYGHQVRQKLTFYYY